MQPDELEIELPSLPKSQNDPQLPHTPSLFRLNSRKRSIRSYEVQGEAIYSGSLHTSSDPAHFSSDETPDAENYSGGKRRKKKTYAGTWWGERQGRAGSVASSSSGRLHITKRKFTRNFDSGVFMCSDDGSSDMSSDSSFGAEFLEDQKRVEEKTNTIRPQTPQKSRLSAVQNVVSPKSPISPRFVKKPTVIDPREQQVMAIIRKCVEDSKEDINLSGMGLDLLPPETREVATMVKDDPSNLIHFDSLVARPRLYLSNNLFRQFPTPVLELSNLRLLSLRQNKLTYIPPGIRNLVKLETLNISGNRLQSLPIEVLDLISKHRLTELHCDPNSWLKPLPEQIQHITENPGQARISARPRSHFTNHSQQPAELHAWHTPLSLNATTLTPTPNPARLPSLAELVLRQLSRVNPTKRDLRPLMPEHTPLAVVDQLQDLRQAQNDGGRQCAKCGRGFISAGRKWIEWWDIMVNGTNIHPGYSGTEHVIHHSDSTTLTMLYPLTATLVLPFEVMACGSCV